MSKFPRISVFLFGMALGGLLTLAVFLTDFYVRDLAYRQYVAGHSAGFGDGLQQGEFNTKVAYGIK
jgi:hypothetical protein